MTLQELLQLSDAELIEAFAQTPILSVEHGELFREFLRRNKQTKQKVAEAYCTTYGISTELLEYVRTVASAGKLDIQHMSTQQLYALMFFVDVESQEFIQCVARLSHDQNYWDEEKNNQYKAAVSEIYRYAAEQIEKMKQAHETNRLL